MLALVSASLPRWCDVRHALADATLVLSLLTGGCVVERAPAPDDDDDEDGCGLDHGCEEELAGGEPDPPADEPVGSSSSPDDIPPSSSMSCCAPHFGVGCNDHHVESCVCGLDPACCTDGWDATCVMTAEQLCQQTCDEDGPWG